jgi:hypothetical protein
MNRQLFSLGFVVVLVVSLVVATHAFAPPGLVGTPSRMANERLASSFGVPSTYTTTTSTTTRSTRRVWMTADNEQEDKAEADEGDDEEAEHVSADLVTEEEPKEEEKEAEPEDELTTLKKEIATLEATLKSKRNTVQYTKDTAEEYSKAGYARKVAEMENMRRVRSVSLSYNYAVEQAFVFVLFWGEQCSLCSFCWCVCFALLWMDSIQFCFLLWTWLTAAFFSIYENIFIHGRGLALSFLGNPLVRQLPLPTGSITQHLASYRPTSHTY